MIIERHLINKCLKGDQHAYKDLYERTVPYVYSIVRRYIPAHEQCKDVVQEVYAQVFLKLGTYDSKRGAFNHWLRRLTINTSLMQLRKHKLHISTMTIEEQHEPPADLRDITNSLNRVEIEQYLEHMPDGYRTIFMLHVIDGYSHEEISQSLHINIQTSRSQLSRSKSWIRNQLIHSNKTRAYGIL